MKRELSLSRYTHLFISSKKKFLVYNSRSNSFLEVSDRIYSQLLQCKEDRNTIALLDEKNLDILLEKKIIVDKEDDNDFLLNLQSRTESATYEKSILSLVIVPTLACNFSCFYCFEEHKRAVAMNEETISAIINLINKHTQSHQLHLTWYGGEPLMATGIIGKLLDQISTKTNIELTQHNLITNGYLFHDEAISIFHQYPLDMIQITLDGNQQRHDIIRKTKNGLPSYEQILKNTDQLLEEYTNTEVHVRVNIENKNKNDYYILAKELEERWKDKNVYIYPGFLRIDNKTRTAFTCKGLNQKEIAEFKMKMSKGKTSKTSLYPQLITDRTCCATRKNSYIIGPEGEIYKCWTDVSDSKKVVGNIRTNIITNKALLDRYLIGSKWYQNAECRECFFLPICSGPCAWYALRNRYENGQYNLCSCIQKVPGMLNKCLEHYYNSQIN